MDAPLEAPLAIIMTPVQSSWVHAIGWQNNTMWVTYKEEKTGAITVTCRYDNVAELLYRQFLASPSKGKFVHAVVRHLDYTIVG